MNESPGTETSDPNAQAAVPHALSLGLPRSRSMRPTTKDQTTKDKKKLKQQASQQKPSQNQKPKEPRRNGQEAVKRRGPNSNNPTARHTTNPSGSCLSRSLVIPNIRKARA